MTNWKLTLSYDGTGFNGWQVQPGLPTVQGALAAAIARVTGEAVLPQGSGRTDAGVHALGQVASFALQAAVPPENLQRALNRALPKSVRVLHAELAAEGFHARHSAVRKQYEYRILERGDDEVCSPFLAPYVWDCRWQLEAGPMARAAQLLVGKHDFTSFAASDAEAGVRDGGAEKPNPVKAIYRSEVAMEAGLLMYRVEGSGFLHHMVRNIVGTLVEVGRGALSVEQVTEILAARDRTTAGPTAPARGLFLVRVLYGEEPA